MGHTSSAVGIFVEQVKPTADCRDIALCAVLYLQYLLLAIWPDPTYFEWLRLWPRGSCPWLWPITLKSLALALDYTVGQTAPLYFFSNFA